MDVHSERQRMLESDKRLMDHSCRDDTSETPAKKNCCSSAPGSPCLTPILSPESHDPHGPLPDNLNSAAQTAPLLRGSGSPEAARRVPRLERAEKEAGATDDGDMGLTSSVAIPSCLESSAIGLHPDGKTRSKENDGEDLVGGNCVGELEKVAGQPIGSGKKGEQRKVTRRVKEREGEGDEVLQWSKERRCWGGEGEEVLGGNKERRCWGGEGEEVLGCSKERRCWEGEGEEVLGWSKERRCWEGEGEEVLGGSKERRCWEGEGEEVLGWSKDRGLEDLLAEKGGQEMTGGDLSKKKNKGANWSVGDFQREEHFFTGSQHEAIRAGREYITLLQPQITSTPGKDVVLVQSSEQVPSSPESVVYPPHFSFNLDDCSYSLFGTPPLTPPTPPLNPVKGDGSEVTAGRGLRIGTPVPQGSVVRHSGPVKHGALREKRIVDLEAVSYLGEKVTMGNTHEMANVHAVPLWSLGWQHSLNREPEKITSGMALHEAKEGREPSVRTWAHDCRGAGGVGEAPERAQTQELLKQVHRILNRLTPDAPQALTQQLREQVMELQINTEEKLHGVADLIFEKAVAKPDFSPVYAGVCLCLVKVSVQTTEMPEVTVNFLRVLLNLCQKEFEKSQEDDEISDRKQRELDDIKYEENHKHLKEKLEAVRNRARRRSLGNVRFVGELFALKMLQGAILHRCIDTLLERPDEEALECLCKLLSSVGKDLDTEDDKPRVDRYFHLIDNIMKERKTSIRIHFMMQDVLELRARNWVFLRRPRTISQMHQEAHGEDLRELIMVRRQLQSRREGGRDGWMGGGLRSNGPHTPGVGSGSNGPHTPGAHGPHTPGVGSGSNGPHTPGVGSGSGLQFPGLKSNVQFSTNQPKRASSSTTSTNHYHEKTSSSFSSTNHYHEKTSSSTTSTNHCHEKTSCHPPSTRHNHEKRSSSTPSTIHHHEKTSNSTKHNHEKTSNSTPSTVHRHFSDPVHVRRNLVASGEDWQRKKQLYLDMVDRHVGEDEAVVTELHDLMTRVAGQRSGAGGKPWRHPSDLTRRNYQILLGNQMAVFSLEQWQNHNGGHHHRFSNIPDVF